MHPLLIPETIQNMRDAGALFVVNHSAGKDSQAMFLHLLELDIPARQLLVIHADLGEVEWPGNVEHITDTIGDTPLIIARARKTLFEMVEHRGRWPSPSQRQCTSDLKRGPIQREIRRFLKAHPEFGGMIVNCMGMRAQESAARAKKAPLRFSDANSKAGRTWYDWLPIHDWTEEEVFARIARAGQRPHWAYAKGMSRLSCRFCIMASSCDLRTSARLNPELYRKYVAMEKRLNHTLSMSGKPLEEITGITAHQDAEREPA